MSEVNLHRTRAQVLLQQGRYDLAIGELHAGLTQSPDDAHLHYLLALCLINQNREAEGLREAEETIRLDPDSPDGYYVAAVAWGQLGKPSTALPLAIKSVELAPFSSQNKAIVAHFYGALNRWRDSLRMAEEALAMNPQNSQAIAIRAVALRNVGRSQEVVSSIHGGLQHDAEDPVLFNSLGWHAIQSGKPREALAHFKEALRIDPTMVAAQHGLAESLRSLNPVYNYYFRFRNWVASRPSWVQWLVILSPTWVPRTIVPMFPKTPSGELLGAAFVLATFAICFLWNVMGAIGNILLLCIRDGRYALTRAEKIATVIQILMLIAAVGLAAMVLVVNPIGAIFGVVGMMVGINYVEALARALPGWPRWISGAIFGIALAAILGVAGVACTIPFEDDRAVESWKNQLLEQKQIVAIGCMILMLFDNSLVNYFNRQQKLKQAQPA